MEGGGHLVLGAGCAGLGLALALVDEGVRAPITVVDRRTAFTRDRTWCLWDTGEPRWRQLAGHRWSSWEVRTTAARSRQHSTRHPYLHLDARAYYAWALERLDRAPNVELRLGERVLGFGERPGGAWARTERDTLRGAWVHDALGLGSPAVDPGAVGLWQGFLGQEVELDEPLFDPGCATLMDFRVAQAGELRFVYVLPFSPTRALVEHTSLGAGRVSAGERREALAEHLAERLGARAWTVAHEEAGRLPMATGLASPVRGARTTAVGIAGGAVRPSSGYAFARTQGHVRALARALAAGERPPSRVGAERVGPLDAVFLRALAARPDAFPAYFSALAGRTSGDCFARFMGDASSRRDELRVMAALAPSRFLLAAAAGPRGPERPTGAAPHRAAARVGPGCRAVASALRPGPLGS